VQPYPNLDAAKILLTLCLGFCAPAVAEAAEVDRAATLEAIHMLENPRDLRRPGPCGELGAYQFRPATWHAYTTQPFERALERNVSDYVAERHFEWLKQRLEAARVPVTTYSIALAWNGGIGAAISGRAPRAARDYAQRATNLAGVFSRHSVVADAK
jgi:hypothetical protein